VAGVVVIQEAEGENALSYVRKRHRAAELPPSQLQERPLPSDFVDPDPRQANRLLRAMPREAFKSIRDKLVHRELVPGEMLYEQHQPVTHAIFPHEGVVSLVAVMEDGVTAESATIGPEGYVGFTALLGERTAINRYCVQIGGAASALPLSDLDSLVKRYPLVRDLMLRYSKALLAQALRQVVCNSLHSAHQRCCRWLLMTHDRVDGDTFHIKQEELAKLLGLRRATVGASCAELQRLGAIQYARAAITITDRYLEQETCECYRVILRNYERLITGPGRTSSQDKQSRFR
jgi:CRP-like cAMP-binding protein